MDFFAPVTFNAPSATFNSPCVSPLMLSDRLITLAQDADRVGLRDAASSLLSLAHEVLEQPTSFGH